MGEGYSVIVVSLSVEHQMTLLVNVVIQHSSLLKERVIDTYAEELEDIRKERQEPAFASISRSIDTFYVDGLSITHGNPRQHIWTYAVGLTDYGRSYACCNCPCAATTGPRPPTDSFTGTNYYCESEASGTFHITFLTHYGTVLVILLQIHAAGLILTNYGSIVHCLQ